MNNFLNRFNFTTSTFFGLTTIVALFGVPTYIYHYGIGWMEVILFFGMMTATMMSITCGYHRLYAHCAYDSSKILKVFYLLFGAAAFQQSCLKWASEHRVHHKHVDHDKDPYNIQKGFWWAHIGWILSKIDPNVTPPQDLAEDKLVQWQHKHWLFLGILVSFGIPTWIGALCGNALGGFLFGGVFRLVVTHHFTFMINSLAHTLGNQPYTEENSAKDNWFTAILTFGEGYHNFHHWYARDYRNGIKFYHWDPGKWFIKSMNWLGLAWDLKQAPEEVVVRAKVEMQRKKLERFQGAMESKYNEMYASLIASLDEFSKKRNQWLEVKRQKTAEGMKSLRDSFHQARAEYRSAYKTWKAQVRSLEKTFSRNDYSGIKG